MASSFEIRQNSNILCNPKLERQIWRAGDVELKSQTPWERERERDWGRDRYMLRRNPRVVCQRSASSCSTWLVIVRCAGGNQWTCILQFQSRLSLYGSLVSHATRPGNLHSTHNRTSWFKLPLRQACTSVRVTPDVLYASHRAPLCIRSQICRNTLPRGFGAAEEGHCGAPHPPLRAT